MKRLGKYDILQEIGRGGFAIVYEARNVELDRSVALKVLHPHYASDPDFAARFQREARAAANLQHPNIVTVHDAGEAEGQLYIAMAYLPGRTLQDLIEAEGALPLQRALPILEGLGAALDYAHAQGVVHRDVKPNNVIVNETESGLRATLMDFGLVKALGESVALTSQGTLLGSPEYMAPEQADTERAAQVGPAADRYALGIVAYQLLTGRVPFPGNTPATLYAHEHKPPPRPRTLRPDLPQAAASALLKMLAKVPTDRFASARAFVAQIRQAMQDKHQERQRQAQLSPLYQRLQTAAAREDWAEVLVLGGQVVEHDPNYRDVPQLMEQAREHIRRPPRAAREPLRLPGWAWAVGALALVGVLFLVVKFAGNTGGPSATATPTFTATSRLPTAVSMITPTFTSTPTATPTRTPTDTPRPPATATRHPTDTPKPSATPTLKAGSTTTREADGMVMVYVPGGEFEMGSEDGYSNEQPVHSVTLDDFWMDRTEVSNVQFAAFLNEQNNQEEGGVKWLELEDEDCLIEYVGGQYQPKSSYAHHPVIEVPWYGAQAYCEWAGARLPTEAEWEYAARGPDGRIYPWGDEFDCSRGNFDDETQLDDYVVPGGEDCDGYERTSPVDGFESGASWCGALNMAGNVWEWVSDWYGGYSSTAQTNPTGPDVGDYKVLRGGSWGNSQNLVRSAYRDVGMPVARGSNVGLRCVRAPGG